METMRMSHPVWSVCLLIQRASQFSLDHSWVLAIILTVMGSCITARFSMFRWLSISTTNYRLYTIKRHLFKNNRKIHLQIWKICWFFYVLSP